MVNRRLSVAFMKKTEAAPEQVLTPTEQLAELERAVEAADAEFASATRRRFLVQHPELHADFANRYPGQNAGVIDAELIGLSREPRNQAAYETALREAQLRAEDADRAALAARVRLNAFIAANTHELWPGDGLDPLTRARLDADRRRREQLRADLDALEATR
jgi:hypothetical protein